MRKGKELWHKNEKGCSSTTYGRVHGEPGIRIWVEQENLIVALFTFETTVKDDLLRGTHRSRVVRNTAWAAALCLHELPLANLTAHVVLQDLMDARQVEPPHSRDGALLQVTSAMYIQTNREW